MTSFEHMNTSTRQLYSIYSIKYNNAADIPSMAVIAEESDEQALKSLEKIIVGEGFGWMKKVILESVIISRTNYLSPKSGIIALQDNMLKKQYP